MPGVRVTITSETNIILFKHMNRSIIDGYKRKGIIPTMREHKDKFEATHGVKIAYNADTGVWKYLDFDTEQDYMMAMLKWL